MMKEITLPSGNKLKVQLATFSVSKALYQAVLKELKEVSIAKKEEVFNLGKNLICQSFSSPEIEKHLWECFKSCTYDDGSGEKRLNMQVFEDPKVREDYIDICLEVAKENCLPFGKSLYAALTNLLAMIPDSDPALRQKTTVTS